MTQEKIQALAALLNRLPMTLAEKLFAQQFLDDLAAIAAAAAEEAAEEAAADGGGDEAE